MIICEKCKHWDKDRLKDGKLDNRRGKCRRYAPRPEGTPMIVFPATGAEDWCGEAEAVEVAE